MEQLERSQTFLVGMQHTPSSRKQTLGSFFFFVFINLHTYYTTQQSHLRYLPKRYENFRSHKNHLVNAYSRFIHNCRKTGHDSRTHQLLNEYTAGFASSEILVSTEKEHSIGMLSNVGKSYLSAKEAGF